MNATSSPVKSAHAALLPNGKVLLIEGSANNANQFAAGTFKTSVWDPVADTFSSVSTPYDMFCSGHAFLANGKLLVAGGTAGYAADMPARTTRTSSTTRPSSTNRCRTWPPVTGTRRW